MVTHLPKGYEVVEGRVQPRHMTGQYCECDECTESATDHTATIALQIIGLTECTKCGTFYDPLTADYDTSTDSPVCDSCVNVAYADCEPDQNYLVFEGGVALS